MLEAAAGADCFDVDLIVLKFDDLHDFLADADEAARLNRFQGLARLDGEDRGLLVQVAQDGAIAVDPLVAREKGDGLVAQDQDNAERGENRQQAAGKQARLNRRFMQFEFMPQIERILRQLRRMRLLRLVHCSLAETVRHDIQEKPNLCRGGTSLTLDFPNAQFRARQVSPLQFSMQESALYVHHRVKEGLLGGVQRAG